jgi:hypothetical protein
LTFKTVLLVKPTGKRGLGFASDTIPLGLEYLAASIANSVERVNIVNMEIEKAPFESFIESFEPDLVGVTMSATDHNEGLRIAEIAKENGCATVLGGYHPTAIRARCIRATVSIRGIEEMWCRLRLLTAIGLESTQLVVNQKIKALEKIRENR